MKRIRSISAPLLAAVLVCLAGQTPARASEFGSFSLKPGETRLVTLGVGYRRIRLCNDSGSAGSVDATIDNRATRTLPPGLCAEDSGDSVELHNLSTGIVSGVYRPVYDFWDGF